MGYAIALDVGTTNIQALLIDTSSKRQIDYLFTKNSQIVYGQDVVTRLGLSLKDKTLHKKINKSLKDDITLLIGLILKRRNLSLNDLDRVIACGNSAMHHILLGLPLEGLARAPFRPLHTGRIYETTLNKLAIDNNRIPFIFLPNLGGFVGSDALCTIIHTHVYQSREPILAIDLGTNGEIILGSHKKIFVTSTSAGPAFEGWHIKCGLYGSTLIDLLSELLNKGIIDKSGFMKEGSHVLEIGTRSVEITQKDIRAFQLAKAAISAGVNILRTHLGSKKITRIYITGLFGTKINVSHARSIGILPEDIDLSKVRVEENAALLGAKDLLYCPNIKKKLDPIIRKIEHIELHKEMHFLDTFTSSMYF